MGADICDSQHGRGVVGRELFDVPGGPMLRRATPRTFVGKDPTVGEEVPTPDPARLVAVDGTLKARLCHRATVADSLGLANVGEIVGEEQVGSGGRVPAKGRVPLRRC